MLHRCVAIGVVESVGKEVDPMLRRKSFVVRFVESIGAQLTAKVFEGDFMVLYPEPKIGDEVACSFGESLEENVDWESKEIKKLTAKTKAKVLKGLVKNWLKGKSDHYRV
jgi:hypothetical protein